MHSVYRWFGVLSTSIAATTDSGVEYGTMEKVGQGCWEVCHMGGDKALCTTLAGAKAELVRMHLTYLKVTG